VTLMSLVIALVGVVCLAIPSNSIFLLGTILLQLWYLLDHVDGQIARYRKTASLTGRFFDYVTHHIIHGAILFSIGICVFKITGKLFFILLGFIGSTASMVFNLINDTKYKTFFDKLTTLQEVKIIIPEKSIKNENDHKINMPLKSLYSFLHKIFEIHIFVNILTAVAIFQSFIYPFIELKIPALIFYSTVSFFLVVTKITFLILTKKIDQEFNEWFIVKAERD